VAADEATRTGLAGMSQIFHVEQVNYALAGTTVFPPLCVDFQLNGLL
jgi:hypothetical protein